MPSPKPLLLPLTSLRFFLALWVVLFHQTGSDQLLGKSILHFPTTVTALLRTGYLAVAIFFVLSGFVLSYNYSFVTSWSTSQVTTFFIARFAKIYPAYFIGLMLVAPFVLYALVKQLSVEALLKQVIIALLNVTLLQAWVPQTALSWNLPGWSLSNEAFFYCCFPFVGMALWRLRRPWTVILAGALTMVAASLSPLLASGVQLAGLSASATTPLTGDSLTWHNLLTYNPLLNLPHFCSGMVLGRVYDELNRNDSWLLNRGYWLYLPGLLLDFLVIVYCEPLPHILSILTVPLHSMVILGFALGGGVVARAISIQPFLFLGDASYSLYIIHVPISLWMKVLAKTLSIPRLSGLDFMAVYVLTVVLLSALVYTFAEIPVTKIIKARLLRRAALFHHGRYSQ